MSEEFNFDWPEFGDVLNDVAEDRGLDRSLVSTSLVGDIEVDDSQTGEDDPVTLDAVADLKQSPQVRPLPPLKIVDGVNIPGPLEPLELDTTRVRELLQPRETTDQLDLSDLPEELPEPEEFSAHSDELEDIPTQEAPFVAAASDLLEETEETEVEAQAEELIWDDDLDDIEGDLHDDLHDDLVDSDSNDNDLGETTLESEVEEEALFELEQTESLDAEEVQHSIEEVDSATDDLAIEWPTETDDTTTDLDLGLNLADGSENLGSWEETGASFEIAENPDESAIVFDMSDEDIIQHERNAGAAPDEDIFLSEDEPVGVSVDPFSSQDDPFADSAFLNGPEEVAPADIDLGGDDNVVDLFDTAPDWANEDFDSVGVASEIENDLLDLDQSVDNVVPIDRADSSETGLFGDDTGSSYQFHGIEGDLEPSSTAWSDFEPVGNDEEHTEQRSWRTLAEDEEAVVAPTERPESDPWAHMRPEEESSGGGWWANRPRFLGGKGKSEQNDEEASIEKIAFSALAYDDSCPSCGENGELRNDDPLAREVHLECLDCANQWHTHYIIDAEAS